MKFSIVFFILLLFPSLSSAKVIFSNCQNAEPMFNSKDVFTIDLEYGELVIDAVLNSDHSLTWTQVYVLDQIIGERIVFKEIVLDSSMTDIELNHFNSQISHQYVFDVERNTMEYSQSLTPEGYNNENLFDAYNEALTNGEIKNFISSKCNVQNQYNTETEEDLNYNESDPIIEIDLEELIPAASGSGFFVSDSGHLVSNFHVIDGCQVIKIYHNGKTYEADILANDRFNDLVLMKVNLSNNKFFKISSEDPKLLEEIITAGFPLGRNVSSSIKTSKGSVTSLAGYGDNYSEFQMDASINQGNSGGPIMNHEGEVVGVAVAIYGREAGIEGFNFGIKASILKTFLTSNKLINSDMNYQNTSDNLEELILKATKYVECWMTNGEFLKALEIENSYKAFIID